MTRAANAAVYLLPLGTDRYHNRYWIMDGVKGLLVESVGHISIFVVVFFIIIVQGYMSAEHVAYNAQKLGVDSEGRNAQAAARMSTEDDDADMIPNVETFVRFVNHIQWL